MTGEQTLRVSTLLTREGRSIERLRDHGTLAPTDFLIVEEPFGRSRPELAGCIDFSVYIYLPLEVALARRMIRDMRTAWADRGRAELEQEIAKYLNWYIEEGYRVYARLQELGRQSSDLVVDGFKVINELTDESEHAIRAAHGQHSSVSFAAESYP